MDLAWKYRVHTCLFLSQRKYVNVILKSTRMHNTKATHFSLPTCLKLNADVGELLCSPSSLPVFLLTSKTTLHISLALAQISQRHCEQRLFYPLQTNICMVGFFDADWEPCLATR
ncbi:hypothetical protein V2J09_011441 [Rumex salicifolius]